MCKAMEEMRAEAAAEAKVLDIRNVMESLKIGVEQAMSILRISGEDADKYKRLVMG